MVTVNCLDCGLLGILRIMLVASLHVSYIRVSAFVGSAGFPIELCIHVTVHRNRFFF